MLGGITSAGTGDEVSGEGEAVVGEGAFERDLGGWIRKVDWGADSMIRFGDTCCLNCC